MEQNKIYTTKKAIKHDDAKDVIKTMLKEEIEDHESHGHWTKMKQNVIMHANQCINYIVCMVIQEKEASSWNLE
jgi:hypothetical protein